MSYKIVVALVIVLSLNAFFFLTQVGLSEINHESPQIFNYNGSLIQTYDKGDYTLDSNVTERLPGGESSVSPTTGNIFTDFFTNIKNSILDSTGLKYVVGIVNAVPNFLKLLGLPKEFTFAIGFIWWLTTFFLLALLLFGKGGE